MGEFQLRGYLMASTAAYIRQSARERGIPDPTEEASAPLRAALGNVTAAGWYPVAYVAELNRLVASALAEGDEGRARTELAACGRYIANEATSTFMRLVMRVLTPSLFAKKLPDLWRRDSTAGRLDLDADDRSLTLRLNEMTGHDHLAAIMPGYVGFALEKMGKEVEAITVDGWSLAKPDASGTRIHFVWKR